MSVLCSGSYLADFIVPDLPEIGPPGSLVYAPKGIHLSPGGHSANVAVDLVQLGQAEVHSTGCVGDDSVGELLVSMLRRRGVQVHPQVAEGATTAKNVALIVRGQDRRFIAELTANALLEPAHVMALLRTLEPRVFYQGTVGGLNYIDRDLARVLEAASSLEAVTVVDAIPPTDGWGNLLRALGGVDVLHCNLREARSMLGSLDAASLLGELNRRGAKLALVSAGGDGLHASTKSLYAWMPAFKVKAVDPTGAGDALCAGVIDAMLMEGAPREGVHSLDETRLKTLMLHGQAAGAACVTGIGATANVTRGTAGRLMEEQAGKLLASTTVREA